MVFFYNVITKSTTYGSKDGLLDSAIKCYGSQCVSSLHISCGPLVDYHNSSQNLCTKGLKL